MFIKTFTNFLSKGNILVRGTYTYYLLSTYYNKESISPTAQYVVPILHCTAPQGERGYYTVPLGILEHLNTLILHEWRSICYTILTDSLFQAYYIQ